jgi:hypothetical protein
MKTTINWDKRKRNEGQFGGGGRNRTGVDGFAGRCMTTLPPRRGGRDARLTDAVAKQKGEHSLPL